MSRPLDRETSLCGRCLGPHCLRPQLEWHRLWQWSRVLRCYLCLRCLYRYYLNLNLLFLFFSLLFGLVWFLVFVLERREVGLKVMVMGLAAESQMILEKTTYWL